MIPIQGRKRRRKRADSEAIANSYESFPAEMEILSGIKERKRTGGIYITTGEAAKMLGLALCTVMRYFDKGTLKGEKHPITGFRRIEMDSVLSLLEKYGMKARK